LNGQLNADVEGIEGLLQCYHLGIKGTTLAGPTYFAKILETIFDKIKEDSANSMNYYLLVMITDGCIHDMSKTKKLLVEMSCYPFSMVVVGVG